MTGLPVDLVVVVAEILIEQDAKSKDVLVLRVLCRHYHRSQRILEVILSPRYLASFNTMRFLRCTLDNWPKKHWQWLTSRIPYKYTERYKDKMDWRCYSHYYCFGEKEYEKYQDYISWIDLNKCALQNFTEEMLEKYWVKLHKPSVSQFKGSSLSDEFVDKYGEDLDWKYVIKKKRPDALLEKYLHKLDWWWTTKYDVSEEFYEKYQDYFFTVKN
ncbi:hypothetical protein BNJ_00361 [Kaumoebavirus]|uniref:hypothetical protein n=1 Tax=Kaumoebavirus TaxID=1859492 RepID=UPI0009C21A8E|nr:hypothetical protein BNJ_00361 [Kaumoebavirus]ARA72181.1 hypothetical protein BNJ_00361 [Kaumoebavirus]